MVDMPDLIDLTSDAEDDDVQFVNERPIFQILATNQNKRTFQNVQPIKSKSGPSSIQRAGNVLDKAERPLKRQKIVFDNNVKSEHDGQVGEPLAIRSSPAPKVKTDYERQQTAQGHKDTKMGDGVRRRSEGTEPETSSHVQRTSRFYALLKNSLEITRSQETTDGQQTSSAIPSTRLPSPPLSPKNGLPLPPFISSSTSLRAQAAANTVNMRDSPGANDPRSGTINAIRNQPSQPNGTLQGSAKGPANFETKQGGLRSQIPTPLPPPVIPSSTSIHPPAASFQRSATQFANAAHDGAIPTKLSSQTSALLPAILQHGTPKGSGKFQTEHEHLLIFLKEVKRYSWSEITRQFTSFYPSFKYHTLQSRYSTVLNKRDRSNDPAQLQLPPKFTSESLIDWENVHTNNPAPFIRPAPSAPSAGLSNSRWSSPDQDTSSGAEYVRPKSTRATRVDYTLRKTIFSVERGDSEMKDAGTIAFHDVGADSLVDRPSRATSDFDAMPLLNTPSNIEPVPIDMDFGPENASVALHAHGESDSDAKSLPYLSQHDRSNAQAPPPDWDWAEPGRHWQGTVLHVDFNPSELEIVERTIVECIGKKSSRHSPLPRRIYKLVKNIDEPTLLRLSSRLQRSLLCRDPQSVRSFLKDAQAGTLSHELKVYRLGNLQRKGQGPMNQLSVSEVLRQREMGRRASRDSRSRQGWPAASRQLTYTLKNRLADSLGPVYSWTGASSDIHTVAWAPDGRSFAAGAVAVDDPDSMQYNRPNNLVYGCLSDGTIHELAQHFKARKKTESGANSTDAMLRSQDPLVYSTVSAVSYSASGNVLYSGGYDGSVCVWDVPEDSSQPRQRLKINMKAQVDMLAVNPIDEDLVATAERKSDNKAIRLIKVEGERIGPRYSFQSSKALERSHLKMLPTALQFAPHYGDFLLAGFGANSRENGRLDTEGDICLWDVETQQQILGYGVGRNIFDIKFNPNRRHGHWFAAGCVAGSNANRGMKSVVKLYVEKDLGKSFSSQMELECRALDINDVVWSPHDDLLLAAGCTDGRVYIWDVRRSDVPMHILSHGSSLMPLPADLSHELTDTGVRFLSWGENDTRLYSGSSDGVVKVWDVTRSEEDRLVKDLITLDSGIMSGAFTDDRSKLLLGEVNGSVHVLDVGRNDYTSKDAEKLRWMPYDEEQTHHVDGDTSASPSVESGITEANSMVQKEQMRIVPLGSLPVRQAVQGPHYEGPFDLSDKAEFLREKAFRFQSHMAKIPAPQCSIKNCKDSVVKVTSEEVGDSGRSTDRIPDELRRLYTSVESETKAIIPGKSKCSFCGRLARPQQSEELDAGQNILCERCSFACFRCGASNPIGMGTTGFICDTCCGTWDIGTLGYECIQQPLDARGPALHPSSFSEQRLQDERTTFGDEMNALSDHYYAMALDRPESPPL